MGEGMGQLRHRRMAAPTTLWGTVLGLLLLAVAGSGFIVASLALMAGGRAYVHGEGRWSKAQQEAVFYLDRYAELGKEEDLARARRALRVPLGDLDARLAMEAPELDRERAVAGLRRGENDPQDIPGMIWLFRYFADAPYVREAVAAWEEADEHILALDGLADRLEKEWASPPPDADAIVEVRRKLGRIDRALRHLETRFSQSLGEGMRRLETLMAVLGVAVLLVFAVAALGLFRWATRRIRVSERKFWASFEHAPLGMALLGADGDLREVNDTFCTIVDRARSRLMGMSVADLLHSEDREEVRRELLALPPNPEARVAVEVRFLRPGSTILWGRLTVSPFPGNGRGTRFIVVLEDVSEAKALKEQLSHEAQHDPLTGLANRRTFERVLDEALIEAREQDMRHTVAFVDLDRFKGVNDTCGHAAGDAALREVAHAMRERLRTSDLIARLGGDEFGIILRRCPADRGREVLGELRSALASHVFTWGEHEMSFGASVGMVEIHAGTPDAASAMSAADQACYQAKKRGGGCVETGPPRSRSEAESSPPHP